MYRKKTANVQKGAITTKSRLPNMCDVSRIMKPKVGGQPVSSLPSLQPYWIKSFSPKKLAQKKAKPTDVYGNVEEG